MINQKIGCEFFKKYPNYVVLRMNQCFQPLCGLNFSVFGILLGVAKIHFHVAKLRPTDCFYHKLQIYTKPNFIDDQNGQFTINRYV